MNTDLTRQIQEQVANAYNSRRALRISAGNSKAFYGNDVEGETLDISSHQGIIEYQPSELVVTARSGTLLSELEAELRDKGQMLAFEPPIHDEHTTIGGVIACGLSGPRRVATGSARDFVLGVTTINGRGEHCRFGGQVMKNVAGYDVARLMTGAQGTLGVMLDISLKVLPIPDAESSLAIAIERDQALQKLRQWLHRGLPLTASCYTANTLTIRLGTTGKAMEKALQHIASEFTSTPVGDDFWPSIRNQSHAFFNDTGDGGSLWRCSHRGTTPFYEEDSETLLEWHGALRWIRSDRVLHEPAASHGGHATRYRGKRNDGDIFQPLSAGMMKLQQRLKAAFDPEHILNRGRLYSSLDDLSQAGSR